MKIYEQAHLSGLAFADCNGPTDEPQWKLTRSPPLPEGRRMYTSSLLVTDPDTNQETLVVFGGLQQTIDNHTSSVLLLNVGECGTAWRVGPRMNESRSMHATVVCNGCIYAIGGLNYSSYLDTIEQISVRNLLEPLSTNDNTGTRWKTLDCRLTSKGYGCAATVVCDRYIVVVGGSHQREFVSSVDIIDTACESQCSGPHMTVSRSDCGITVIGQRLYVVGGCGNDGWLNSVEYMEFNASGTTLSSAFPSSTTWKIHKNLALNTPRQGHAIAKVGRCLIVAGGSLGRQSLCSVEVMDTEKNITWELPEMTIKRDFGHMVVMSTSIVVVGGDTENSCETISLVTKNSRLFARLIEFSIRPELWT